MGGGVWLGERVGREPGMKASTKHEKRMWELTRDRGRNNQKFYNLLAQIHLTIQIISGIIKIC